ncbi:type II toxin-antitoxin system RelE family toxin [Pseudorhodoplanes sp.]|uniref:type II toxin-antitoxin system RelE family toxin n=1 Tax=Pseudorhodoplanes sp. TaxID=1934341 RepID=UPI00391A196D
MGIDWQVELLPEASRDLKKLGRDAQATIVKYLRQRIATSENPRRLGRALTGDKKGFWRYRVGNYRIVAAIEDNRLVVVVVAVGHRREVYG